MHALGVARDTVRQVVVTHAHPDHVMAIPVFREMFPNVSVVASESAAKTLQIEKAVSFFCKMDGALTDWLIGSGLMAEAESPGAAGGKPDRGGPHGARRVTTSKWARASRSASSKRQDTATAV